MARCPKCGSTNVKFELHSAGTASQSRYYRTGVRSSWFLPAGERAYKSSRKQKSIGLCQNCGYHWEAGKGFFIPVSADANILTFLIGLVSLIIGIIFFISLIAYEDAAYPVLQFIEAGMLVVAGGIALYDYVLPDKTAGRWIWPGISGVMYLGAGLMNMIYALIVHKSNIFSGDICIYAIFAFISFCRMVHQYRKEKRMSQKSVAQTKFNPVQNMDNSKIVISEDDKTMHTEPVNSKYDDLLIDAARFILSKQRVGIGMLQRELKIGFNRAERIMEQLNQIGVIEYSGDLQKTYIRVTSKEFEEQIVKNI